MHKHHKRMTLGHTITKVQSCPGLYLLACPALVNSIGHRSLTSTAASITCAFLSARALPVKLGAVAVGVALADAIWETSRLLAHNIPGSHPLAYLGLGTCWIRWTNQSEFFSSAKTASDYMVHISFSGFCR